MIADIRSREHVILNDENECDDYGSIATKLYSNYYDGELYVGGAIKIFDCHRSIKLNLDAHKKRHLESRIRKVRRMIDCLESLEKKMIWVLERWSK